MPKSSRQWNRSPADLTVIYSSEHGNLTPLFDVLKIGSHIRWLNIPGFQLFDLPEAAGPNKRAKSSVLGRSLGGRGNFPASLAVQPLDIISSIKPLNIYGVRLKIRCKGVVGWRCQTLTKRLSKTQSCVNTGNWQAKYWMSGPRGKLDTSASCLQHMKLGQRSVQYSYVTNIQLTNPTPLHDLCMTDIRITQRTWAFSDIELKWARTYNSVSGNNGNRLQ